MADEESAMVVSAVLDEFFDAHSTETSLPCAAIIVKLIKNAALQEKFRRVRLSNPKIQQGIVRIAGALDILALAGFAQEEEQEFLVYTPPSTELTLAICNQLESRMLLEEKEKLELKSRPVKTTTTTTTTTSFLSDEERRERQKKARNAKRARNAERAETHQRWLEDKRDRQEAAARKEAALAAAAKKEIAPGITIRPLPTNDNNDYRAKIAASWRAKAGQEKEDEKATTAESDMDIENDAQIQPTTEMDCDLRNDGLEEDRKLPAVPPSTARAASDLGAEDMKLPAKKTPILPSEDHENTTNIENVVSLPSAASNDSLSDLDRKLPAKSSFSPSQQEPSTAGVGGDEDRKLPAKSSFSPSQQEPPSEWDACLEHLPLCAPAEGIRESSVYFRPTVGGGEQRRPTCLKRLLGELDSLGTMLPLDARCSIFVRFDEETPQYLRALMAAPLPGPTPYSGGLFCFDIYIPNDYPNVPPKFKLLTTGGGTVRFGPNLYADGKVCLSLLGTWPGPKWSPRHSTLYQVLISIQGLVLGVEHPYFLEPGHGGWEGRIKEGDFQAVGKTLKGEEVKEEIRLPREVGAYEDILRVGTIRFAMLETLQGVVVEDTSNDGGGVQVLKASKHLAPFALPILAHFYHNREAILTEVRSWLTDRASSAEQLKRLVPRLEAKLLALSPPQVPPAVNGEKKDAVHLETNQSNAPSECRITSQAESNAVTDVAMSNNDGDSNSSSPIESLRRQMQEAATAGDFVLAGRLQSKVQQLEDLERRMKEAAAENNFIRAGRLQEQYQALLEEEAAAGGVEDMSEDGEEAEGEEWDADDEFSSTMGPSGGQPHPLMGHNNVFVPSGYHNQYTAGNHSWGSGYQLSSTEASSATAVTTTTASIQGEATVPRKPYSDSCRLRIRLPVTSKSVVEEFDCNDPLSSVYRRLEPQIRQQRSADGNTNSRRALATPSTILTQPLGITSPSGTQAVAVSGGAFARPLSVAGYTLLLSHPKREYSLEMHGTKSLLELGLTPSATLTVMMCADRGVVYRGDLESRLDDAQGNAMDVDGLTYEGLLELTERVGVATPEHGRAFIDEETLERNSILVSPASYMTELDTSTMDVSASHADEQEDVVTAGHRCPICLGDFDVNDTEQSLRKLKKCSHVFHIACLATWLTTKSSCPICKQSLS